MNWKEGHIFARKFQPQSHNGRSRYHDITTRPANANSAWHNVLIRATQRRTQKLGRLRENLAGTMKRQQKDLLSHADAEHTFGITPTPYK